ncbi:MAG TPA: hypothetical protein VI912_04415 [Candidatus Bilamarchaeaceae archaeon]|nr:hypothetical protein [Candidatus Bilamarchaeaceae archaeon]
MSRRRFRTQAGDPQVIRPGQFAKEGGSCIEVAREGIVHSRFVGEDTLVAFRLVHEVSVIALLPFHGTLNDGHVFRVLSDEITSSSETRAVTEMSGVMRRLLGSGVDTESLIYPCPDGAPHYHGVAVETPDLNGDLRMHVLDHVASEYLASRSSNFGFVILSF